MKKKEKEVKRTGYEWIVVIGIFIVALAIIISNISIGGIKEISVDKYLDLYENSERSYVYIGKTSCENCEKIKPNINKAAKELNISINYINYEELSKAEQTKLTQSANVLKGTWGTPMLLIIENGAVADSHQGYADYNTVKEFLSAQDLSTKEFNHVTVDQYLSLLNGPDKSYIYIGRTGCSYCQMANPIVSRISTETGIVINYVNIENITQDEYTKLTQSNDVLKGDWGTPTLLIVQGGKVIDSHIGYAEYDVLKSFLLQTGK